MNVERIGVLAVIGKPLRKITRVIRYADSVYGTQRVGLECGHEASASCRASSKARCAKCQTELRAAVAELIEASTACISHGGHEVVTPGVAAARVARLRAALVRLQGEGRA